MLSRSNVFDESAIAGRGRIDAYQLDNVGLPVTCTPTSNVNARAPEGRMPFAFTFGDSGQLLMAEVLGRPSNPFSPLFASAVSSYTIRADGSLGVITASLGNGQSASCWIVRSDRFVYTSNFASDSISRYRVQKNGALVLEDATAAQVGPGLPAATPDNPPAFALDMDLSVDGRFLYLLTPGISAIHAFFVNPGTGKLIPRQVVHYVEDPFSQYAGMATAQFE